MFHLIDNQTTINVEYDSCIIIYQSGYSYADEHYKKIIKATDTIPGIENDCGGGGRRCSCYCTTAAIILIFETLTNNDQSLIIQYLFYLIFYKIKKNCDLTNQPKDNRKLLHRFKTKTSVHFVQIINPCAKVILISCTNIQFELKLRQKPIIAANISIQEITFKLVLIMISPASTCMGTIHKYYEKIKDAVEDPKP